MSETVQKRTLAKRLIVSIILFSSFVTILTTVYQLYVDYAGGVADIERRFGNIETGYISSVADNLWVADEERLRTQADGIVRLPDFVHVAIMGDGGIHVTAGTKSEDAKALRRTYDLTYLHRGKRIAIGSMVVTATTDEVWDRIWSRVWLILGTNAIKTFFVALFMFYVVHRLITRHIASMVVYTHGLTTERLDEPLRLEREPNTVGQEDELDELVGAINDLRTRLKQSYSTVLNLNQELERRVLERTRELETEVAARKRTEDAYHESELRFRDMVEADSDWQWEMGPDLRFTYFSDSVLHNLGMPPEYFIGKNRSELAQVCDDSMQAHLDDLEQRRSFRDFTYSIPREDGRSVYLRVSGKPVFGEDGSFLGYRGTGINVTELVEAQHRGHEVETRYRGLIELSPIAVLVERGGAITFANPSAADILGAADSKVLLGRHLSDFVDTDQLSRNLYDRGRLIEPLPQNPFHEQKTKRLDGREIYVEWADRQIPYEGVQAHMVLLSDVTERHRAAEALMNAKEQAEFASRTKSEFLATMSHELRTPLNAIIGFSDTIIAELFGPLANDNYRDYIGHIHDSGVHLLELINDVLDVSAVEAGKLELNEELFDLVTLAETVLRLVSPRATQGEIDLVNNVSEDLPPLLADERRTKQILLNLLSNAVKFTPEGGRVVLGATLNDEGGLEISVGDTGIGMSADDIEVAIAPFGQVDSSLARRYEGTGLGLPLVKGFMEAHGGEMIIHSMPGKGTEVTVVFPPRRVRRDGFDAAPDMATEDA